MTKLVHVLTCECNPGFVYKTSSTFKSHFKSIRHINFMNKQQEFEHRKEITKLQIKYDKLVQDHTRLKKLYLDLAYENLELKEQINHH